MLPVVFDLDQPRYIAFNAKDIDGLAAIRDRLKLIAIERPVIIFAGLATIRKTERESLFRYRCHQQGSVLGMKQSTKRSD